jgi:hypothetical protein
VTRGIVSGFDEISNLKTDAEVNPGNSGGAAFDDLDTFLDDGTTHCGRDGFLTTRHLRRLAESFSSDSSSCGPPTGSFKVVNSSDALLSSRLLEGWRRAGLPASRLGRVYVLPHADGDRFGRHG